MQKKIKRQRYFVAKELRTSIALIILWSLLATAFFTFFAKELGEKIGNSSWLFILVMFGYIIIVIVLTMLFSHRLIGPFQRLKTEIKLIKAGDYHRRLNVRGSDDIYIRSFIYEVNEILDEFEEVQSHKKGIIRDIESELINIISLIEEGEKWKDTPEDELPVPPPGR